MHGHDVKENMDDFFVFKEFVSFFKRLVLGGCHKHNFI